MKKIENINIEPYQYNNSKSSLLKASSINFRPYDSREGTCQVIYDTYRRQKLEGKKRTLFVFLLSTTFAIAAIICIGLMQYDEYFAFMNDRFDYVNQTRGFCNKIDLANIDIISTPIAAALVIFYIIIYKRRLFLRNKFKYRNIGLPMIISCWKKKDRLLSAFTYGLIAFNVFQIVRNTLNGVNNSKKLLSFKDPSGLIPLMIKVCEMFLIGIRYYPVLVAFRVNTFLINITCAAYMWIDYIENIYQYGKCESIAVEAEDKEDLDKLLNYFIAYKVLSSIPFCIFSSSIVVTLTYKSCINLMDFIFRYSSLKTRSYLIEKSKDSCGCLLCNVEDEHEIIYSKYDLDYVLKLFKSGDKSQSNINKDNKNQLKLNKKVNNTYLKVKPVKKDSFLKKILNKIYNWDPTFRFTSRYVNSITVASVALYYIFIFWLYNASTFILFLTDNLPDIPKDIKSIEINPHDILCGIAEEVCLEQLSVVGSVKIPLPKQIASFLPELKDSVNAVVIVPAFGALLICLLQLFIFIKETKVFLKELYVGKCEFVKKASSIGNQSIASASFHFGGYLTGYLIWGYVINYGFIVLIGVAIILIRMFVGDKTFEQIALRCVPIICVLIVKQVLNKIFTNIVFLDRKSNILALDNFRAFNVFLYFNFYFDCFMGVISAFIRLIKSAVIAVLMMPRLSYSFLGRHWERMDNAYACYSGFLHMEAMHTNSILITFISTLYYKDLAEHIVRYRRAISNLDDDDLNENDFKFKLKKFKGRLSITSENINKHYYNKTIVNRWHLYAMLIKNKNLIPLRKQNLITKEKQPSVSIVVKIKNVCKKFCCCKKCMKSNK